MPAPPWHMWGSVQTIPVESDVVHFSDQQQLVQVAYGRPESWRFFLKVAIGTVVGSPAGFDFTFDFNISFGVGRASTKVAPFARFIFTPAEFVAGNAKQVTSVEFAKENAARVSNNVVDHFVAETIQVETSASFSGLGLLLPGTSIIATAFLAPDVHIRPEWHAGSFPGGEHRGH